MVEKQTAVEVEQDDEKDAVESFVRVEKQTQELNAKIDEISESDVIPSTSSYIPFPASTQELRKYRPNLNHYQMAKPAADEMSSSVADSRKSSGKNRARR